MTELENGRSVLSRIKRFFRVATDILKVVEGGPYGTLENRVKYLED